MQFRSHEDIVLKYQINLKISIFNKKNLNDIEICRINISTITNWCIVWYVHTYVPTGHHALRALGHRAYILGNALLLMLQLLNVHIICLYSKINT